MISKRIVRMLIAHESQHAPTNDLVVIMIMKIIRILIIGKT